MFIQITVFNTRTAEQKKALFRRIAELLGESPGIRPEDVFVNVLDAAKENWSVGRPRAIRLSLKVFAEALPTRVGRSGI